MKDKKLLIVERCNSNLQIIEICVFHGSAFPGDHAGRPVPIMPIFPKLLVCNVSELRLMSSQSDFLRHSPRLRAGSDR